MNKSKTIIVSFTSSEETNFETAIEQAIRFHTRMPAEAIHSKEDEYVKVY